MKKIGGNVIVGLGILLLSATFLLKNESLLGEGATGILLGVSIGIEILGAIRLCREKKA